MTHQTNFPKSKSALASVPQPSIRKIVATDIPAIVHAEWRNAGSVLEHAGVVDGRHVVLVFSVDYASLTAIRIVPIAVTKYTDNEAHAPYRASHLKMAALRHYRNEHTDLEGTWDPMEGRSRVVSNLEEFCTRHGVHSTSLGARHVTTDVTYGTEDASLVYCTSRTEYGKPRYRQWNVGSVIRDVPKFSLLLGAEFARQSDESRNGPVTPLDQIVAAFLDIHEPAKVVHIHHGTVVYNDDAGEVLFSRFPEHERGLAAHFFKRSDFRDQHEYRFVLHSPGSRPLKDEFYLKISPELRAVFHRR